MEAQSGRMGHRIVMAALSNFESRKGSLSCTPSEIFDFVSDIRNLRQFVPENVVEDLVIEENACSFSVPAMGKVIIRLSEKEPVKKLVYSGNALQSNDFSLVLDIMETAGGKAEVMLRLAAYMNPVMKMMASGLVSDFLEKLIMEMERFRNWKQKA
ncbi:MAG TPA: hypothetical protein PKY14_01930 [Bacteroidales bacterium]|jgi:carbon monoxide dehydrogenase subunit G|nr:hypothetical protein [Bacteroidales bacterium]